MYDPFSNDFSSPTSSPATAAAVTAAAPAAPAFAADVAPKRARPSRWGQPMAAGGGRGFPGTPAVPGAELGASSLGASGGGGGGGTSAAGQACHQNGVGDAAAGLGSGPRSGLAAGGAAVSPAAAEPQGAPALGGPTGRALEGLFPGPPPGSKPKDPVLVLQAALDAQQLPPLPDAPPGTARGPPTYPNLTLAYDLGPDLRAAWGLPHPDDPGHAAQAGPVPAGQCSGSRQ